MAQSNERLKSINNNNNLQAGPIMANGNTAARSIPILKEALPRLTISVVIVNWNTQKLLAQCLHTVFADLDHAGLHERAEVFVIDNASSDDSVTMIRSQFPRVTVIENSHNPGFATANNQALRQCAGEYVLLLNPDTEVLPSTLRTLIAFAQTQPKAGIITPRILNPDCSLQESTYPLPSLMREVWRMFHLDKLHALGIYRMHDWDLKQPREVESALGACLLVRRSVLAQIGLLDEDYFMYSEEIDLCARARKAGWQIWWVPQAQVIHYGGQSTRQVAVAMFLTLYEGKVKYFRKHLGARDTRLYKSVLMGAALARLSVSPLILVERVARREHHLQLTRAYRQLLLALPRM